MAQRLRLNNGEVIIEPTRLFSESLIKTGNFFVVEDPVGDDHQPLVNTATNELNDLASLINELKEDWPRLHSEQIVSRLDPAFNEAGNGGVEAISSIQLELSLIKALALEKSVIAEDRNEADKYYAKCRGSIFQTVLVLNNSGVIEARQKQCAAALELFRDAMIWAYRMNSLAKAPFYNFALIIAHLYRQRFIFHPDYLRILEESVDSLPFLQRFRKVDANGNGATEATEKPRTDEEIRDLCEAIAQYSHGIVEPGGNDFYRSALTFVLPEIDLPGSFGEIPDKVDRESAAEVFSDGSELFDQKLFDESIRSFELASTLSSDFSSRASSEIDKVSNAWRLHENEIILKLVADKEFDEALTRLQSLPDKRLERESDHALAEVFRKQKQGWLLREADKLADQGQMHEAKLKYKQLLREDLNDQLRKHISTKLARLLESDGTDVRKDRPDR
jgi:hypothetical protein